MKQEVGKALLVVFMEPKPETEGQFNEWYNQHHVPERVSVPGILSARRYELCEGEGVKYLAIYELEDESVLHSDAYLERRDKSTPMDFERPQVQRLVYRQIFPPQGPYEGSRGVMALAVPFSIRISPWVQKSKELEGPAADFVVLMVTTDRTRIKAKGGRAESGGGCLINVGIRAPI